MRYIGNTISACTPHEQLSMSVALFLWILRLRVLSVGLCVCVWGGGGLIGCFTFQGVCSTVSSYRVLISLTTSSGLLLCFITPLLVVSVFDALVASAWSSE